MHYIKPIVSWLMTLWIARVFLVSLTYKFTGAPETQHIFGTIGDWMGNTITPTLGSFFTSYGAHLTGTAELIISITLLLPALIWLLSKVGITRARAYAPFHALGGLAASIVMIGAVSFHLITPLGIEVLHEGQSDGGSLFYTGVSILIMGLVMFAMHFRSLKKA